MEAQLERDYRNVSAAEFERFLYEYIYDLEEPTLEEQLADRQAVGQAEFEEWQERNARAREERNLKRESRQ